MAGHDLQHDEWIAFTIRVQCNQFSSPQYCGGDLVRGNTSLTSKGGGGGGGGSEALLIT